MDRTEPGVLFVCVRNSGKSQLAAALMRHRAGTSVRVYSAGTEPGQELNPESVASLAEWGIPVPAEHPKPISPELLRTVDLIVVLGRAAVVEPKPGIPIRTWDTPEPSEHGIGGIARMRLIRDDIDARVRGLLNELRAQD